MHLKDSTIYGYGGMYIIGDFEIINWSGCSRTIYSWYPKKSSSSINTLGNSIGIVNGMTETDCLGESYYECTRLQLSKTKPSFGVGTLVRVIWLRMVGVGKNKRKKRGRKIRRIRGCIKKLGKQEEIEIIDFNS